MGKKQILKTSTSGSCCQCVYALCSIKVQTLNIPWRASDTISDYIFDFLLSGARYSMAIGAARDIYDLGSNPATT
jgi:hypothetical protein